MAPSADGIESYSHSTTATHTANTVRVGLLILGRTRPGFDQQWGRKVAETAKRQMLASNFPVVFPAVDVVADTQSLRQQLKRFSSEKVNVLLVMQPCVSNGILAVELARRWKHGVVFWATPENPNSEAVSSCSLVGTHLFASIWRQRGRAFRLVYGDANSDTIRHDVEAAVREIAATYAFRNSRIGLIGDHAPGFANLAIDPRLTRKHLGIKIKRYSIKNLISLMNSINNKSVAQVSAEYASLGLKEPNDNISNIDASYYLAMRYLMQRDRLNALAIRCWPELPDQIGQWPYVAVVRFLTEGVPVAVEGDVEGAMSLLAARLHGAKGLYLSDWLGHDERSLTLWHAGDASLELCARPGEQCAAKVSRHFNNDKPGVVESQISSGQEVTLLRLWHCEGCYHLLAMEGITAPVERQIKGTHGRVVFEHGDLREVFVKLCRLGMPHHLAVVQGRYADALSRFADDLKIEYHRPLQFDVEIS